MNRNLGAAMIGIGLLVASSAQAHAQDSNDTTYAPPRLSPYLNLGVSSSGLSTYPTLVRPLIDDQEAIARQSAEIERLQRQLRSGKTPQKRPGTSREAKIGATNANRFMNYSHYFVPTARETDPRAVTRPW